MKPRFIIHTIYGHHLQWLHCQRRLVSPYALCTDTVYTEFTTVLQWIHCKWSLVWLYAVYRRHLQWFTVNSYQGTMISRYRDRLRNQSRSCDRLRDAFRRRSDSNCPEWLRSGQLPSWRSLAYSASTTRSMTSTTAQSDTLASSNTTKWGRRHRPLCFSI